ncbi:transporter [Candidatus Methylopumilus universalis]|uniref:transporter n=1 Tax=Candidatus Methylopumilus universalis TaxID=2588536 RepID=UPI0011229DB4|nr:transporter [Candidatus Methylopumilus universalis]QDC80103.1 transporter [Candidatus Methylopumilus universalis]QDC81404.1 transporter [Candidatus Methylopumilus universalis]QDC87843.1 transporter [Candidatus Methylopumilus universalis]
MLINYLNKFKLLYVITLAMISNITFAIDLQPGEIKAPAGTFNAAQMSYVYVEKGDKYTHGSKTSSTSNINQNAFLLRLSHAFEINQIPAIVYAASSINHLENRDVPNAANTNSNGIGDTTLVFALWPYVDRAKEEYVGLATYLTLPTGEYDKNSAVNIGSNVYQTAFQAGYQRKLIDNVNWMSALDVVLAGDNKQFLGNNKLEKDPLYNFQTGLQYVFNPTYSASVGYFYTVGGESTVNSIDQGNINKIHRYQLTGQGIYNFGRLMLQYGSEFVNENSYIEDHRLIARYAFKF